MKFKIFTQVHHIRKFGLPCKKQMCFFSFLMQYYIIGVPSVLFSTLYKNDSPYTVGVLVSMIGNNHKQFRPQCDILAENFSWLKKNSSNFAPNNTSCIKPVIQELDYERITKIAWNVFLFHLADNLWLYCERRVSGLTVAEWSRNHTANRLWVKVGCWFDSR